MRKQKSVNRALVQVRRADQPDRSRLLSLIPQYCPLPTSWIIATMNFDTDMRANFDICDLPDKKGNGGKTEALSVVYYVPL